jgi:PKD repeat protein
LATDKGLYDGSNLDYESKIDLGLPDYEAFDFANNKGELLVATTIGVLKLTKTTCDDYKASIKKSTEYLCITKNEQVSLFPQCNNGTNKWHWDFGDGSVSELYNPSHKYSIQGNYKISLISSNGYCKDTVTTKISVYKDSINLNFRFEHYTGKPFLQKTNDGEINIIDFNNDGNPDIFIPGTGLFENVDSSELYLKPTQLNYIYRNSIWADMDNDGFNDLVYGGLIYKNMGNLNFKSFSIGYSDDHMGFIDVNNDGLLDIIFGGGQSPVIFKNLGGMKFVRDTSVIFPVINYINQFKWFDLNGDGKNDLLILTNPRNSGICCTYKQNIAFFNENGKLVQKDFAPLTNVQGKNCLVADVNNDKLLDIFMQYGSSQSSLFINTGKNFETNNSTLLQCTTYATFSDLDNDGWQDYISNELFSNYGGLVFANTHDTTLSGLKNWVPEANASADLDRDGKPELVLGSGDGYNTHVYNNSYLLKNKSLADNNWIKVNCWGTKSNYNAIGAAVYIKTKLNGENKWQSRLIEAENNLSSQNGFEQIFGTEKSASIDTLQVNWPSGITTTLTNLAADKTYQIIEPAIRFKGDTITCDNEVLEFTMPKIKDIKYHWFYNDTDLGVDSCYFRVRKSGVYKCYIESPYFGYYSANLNVTVNKAPVSTIWFKDNKSVFCMGDSLIIESQPLENLQYAWMNKGIILDKQNNSFITVKMDGAWNLIVVNEKNCRDTSNALFPVINPLPNPTLPELVKVCRGDSGLISIPNIYSKYLWSTGDTLNYTYAREAGTITFKVQDFNKCNNLKQVKVQILELPFIDLGEDITLDYGLVIYHPMTYCDFFAEYKWSDGLTNCDRNFITNQLGFGKHILSASVIDRNGCENSGSVTVAVLPKGWNEENKLIIFPNPASDKCVIYLTSMVDKKVIYEIINNSGTVIKSETCYPTINAPVIYANLSNISSGLYIVRVSDSKTTMKLSLLIQHR